MISVFCCGWECGDAGGLSIHWSLAAGSPAISTTTVRSGARSLRCNPSAATAALTATGAHTSSTRHVGRFYIHFATLPTTDTRLAVFGAIAGTGPCVRFKQSDAKIYAAVDTTLGASGVSVTTGQWYCIDYDFNVNTSGADFCDVRVDNAACGQATGTGTSSGAITDIFGILNNCSADAFYDDVVLSSTAADYPIGAGFVNHFIAASDGAHNIAGTGDFQRGNTGTDILNATTTAFQLIDDVPIKSAADSVDSISAIAPPNATDYVEIVFGPASGISTPTVGPRAVECIVGHHQSATQSGNIRIALNDNGSTDDVLNLTAAGVTTIRYARKHYSDPPSAASTWVVTSGNGNFNNVRMRFFSSDAAPDQFWDTAVIEAEFAEAGSELTQSLSDDVNNFTDARLVGHGHLYTDSVNNLADTALIALGLPLTLSDNANNLADAEAHVLGVTTTTTDSLQALTDALIKLLSYELAFADSEAANWADSHQLLLAHFLALADSYTLTDANVIRMEQRVGFTDTLNTLSDAAVLQLGTTLTLTDTLNALTDAYTQIEGELKSFTDSLTTPTDSLALGHGFLFADSLNALTDAVKVEGDSRLEFSDTLTLADSEAHQLELRLVFAETLALTDSITLGYGLLITDLITIDDSFDSDIQDTVAATTKAVADTLQSLSDALVIGIGLVIADSVTLTDSLALSTSHEIALNDSLPTLTDTSSLRLGQLLSFDDSFVLVDSQSSILGYNQLFTDTLSLTDAESNQLGQLLDFSDVITLTDARALLLAHLLTFNDALSLTDSAALLMVHLLNLTDDANFIADLVQTDAPQGPNILVGVTDALPSLSDSIQLQLGYHFSLSDNAANWADSAAITLGLSLIITDNGPFFTESISFFSAGRLQLADTLTLTDSLAKSGEGFLLLADSLTLTDEIDIDLRGPDLELALTDALTLTDAISIVVSDELRLELTLTDVITLLDHYFDLRHPYTPSAKRHIVVPSHARETRVPAGDRETVPRGSRVTRVP